MVVLAPGEPGVPVTCCAEAGVDTDTRPHSKIVVEMKLRRALHVDPDILAYRSSGGLFAAAHMFGSRRYAAIGRYPSIVWRWATGVVRIYPEGSLRANFCDEAIMG